MNTSPVIGARATIREVENTENCSAHAPGAPSSRIPSHTSVVPAQVVPAYHRFLDLGLAHHRLDDDLHRHRHCATNGLVGPRPEDWHLRTAGAFVTTVVPLLVFLALQRFFVRGLLPGSVKG